MFIAASVFAMTGLSSCSNENDPGMTPPEGDKGIPTAMSLTLNMNGVQTRASEGADDLDPEDFVDDAAGEDKVNTLHVYIYSEDGGLERSHNLNRYDAQGVETGDITYDVNQKAYKTKALTAFTGAKTVYVGLNLTTEMQGKMATSSLQTLKTTAVVEELKNMINATGFSMFSPEGEPADFGEATADEINNGTVPVGNTVVIAVERLVAKIGVGATKTPAQLGAPGTLVGNELKWVVDNIGKKFYMPATQEDPSMKAVLWKAEDFLNYNFKDDEDWETPAQTIQWKSLLTNVDDKKTWETSYSTENFVDDNKLKGMTRVVVRGYYTPAQEITYTLNTDGSLEKAKTPIGDKTTYYQVVIKGDDKYVFLASEPTEDGVKAYYQNVTGNAYGAGDIMDECVKEYTGGANYWWVTMKETGSDGNVERNHVYLANVKSISFPGRTEGEFNDEKDKDEELDKVTNIDVEVTVLPWYLVAFDTDLRP